MERLTILVFKFEKILARNFKIIFSKFKWDIFRHRVMRRDGKIDPIFFLLNFLPGKSWFSNFLMAAHEILFGFQISYGGFDIFSGRTLPNWQARFFDHFFIPRAHEFSNGIRSVGKVWIKGVWKKITRSLHNFKPKIEIPIFITYCHKRKKTKQDRNWHDNTAQSFNITKNVSSRQTNFDL